MGVSPEGLTLPSGSEMLNEMVSDFEDLSGLSLNLAGGTEGNAVLTLMAVVVRQLSQAQQITQAAYDAAHPETSEGVHAEDAAAYVGVTPEAATYSTATATLAGTSGTLIPAGSLVEGGGADGKARWSVQEAVTLASGTGTASLRAVAPGRVEASAGEIDKIVTAVSGWSAVTNAAAAIPGKARQGGAELRAKRRRGIAVGGSSSVAAIRAAILGHPSVDECVVLENRLDINQTISGKALTPHSMWIFLTPSTLTDAEEIDLATRIHRKLTPGGKLLSSGGGSTVTRYVTDAGGKTQRTVTWDYGTSAAAAVTVTVTLKPGYSISDVRDGIESAVEAYFAGLGMGDIVYEQDLRAAVVQAGVLGLADIEFAIDLGALPYTPNIDVTVTLGSVTVTT